MLQKKQINVGWVSAIISLEVGTSKNFVLLLMEIVHMEFIFDKSSYQWEFLKD